MAQETWNNYLEKKHTRPGPLKGIRVIEACTLILGPAGASFLAKLGAEVIKCEIPPLGDTSRNLGPFGECFREQGTGFVHANQNKYFMGLDLHRPEAQEIFQQLAAKSDVVEENMRPGVLEKWNVGYRQLSKINPGIIYISKNGFGQWGQYAMENRPSNDGASQAQAGFSWMSAFPGQRPLRSRLYIADNYGALMGEIAVLAALRNRQKTGKGQYIELSQAEALIRTMSWVWPYQSLTGRTAGPEGNRDVCVCPADTFRCKDDDFVAIAAPTPEEFKGLCAAMGQPKLADDPKFKDHLTRLLDANAREILDIIGKWAREKKVDDIVRLAEKHGFAATRVLSVKDIVEDQNFRKRGAMAFVDDPVLGPMYEFDFPVLMSRTPPKVRWSVRAVGFDNEYVLTSILAKNKEQIKKLYECRAVGKWADMVTRRPPAAWDGKTGLIMSRENK
ncbi:MAG TPA: CoA transferase [Acidobacteriota bacterium]|nr:CoA transferase [Acidobacteriota bacterium]